MEHRPKCVISEMMPLTGEIAPSDLFQRNCWQQQ